MNGTRARPPAGPSWATLAAPLCLSGLLIAACGVEEIQHRVRLPAPDAAPSGPDAADVSPTPPPTSGPPPTSSPPPTPAPAPPGVTIAGRLFPRDKVIVLLHIGHSNMAGRATSPADLRPYFDEPDPRLWVYAGGGGFQPAKEPTAPDNQNGQAAGPGMALLRSALAAAPPDTMIVSVGHGHSGSFGGTCSAFRRGGLLYDQTMQRARELVSKVTFGAIFTMFGQSEHRLTASEQQGFSDCLDGVARDMRGDLNQPLLPFLVGDYEAGISRSDIHPTSQFGRLIIAQIQMVPGKTPRSAIIPTDGLPMQDTHHFNLAGHKGWAQRAVDLLIDRGWAPW